MSTSITDYLAGQKPATSSIDQSAAVAGASKTAAGKASLATSYQTFLTLLTSQLKNQDPLKPMDTDSFTQQLVSMTGVEQQLLSNDLLQSLVDQTTSGSNLNAVSLIGKDVTAQTGDGALVNGAVSWDYDLPKAAASVVVQVTDSKGAAVWTGTAPSLDAGRHTINWDGKSNTGVQQPDGVYTVALTAKDSDGVVLTAPTYFTGRATSLEHDTTGTLVNLGGVKASINNVQSVRDPATA